MDDAKIAKSLGLAILGLTVILITPILSCLVGAFSGWIVSFVFDGTIKTVLKLQGIELWQLGATLGFLGGFFRINTGAFKKDGVK